MNYYNDNEKTSAAWLRELIKQGLIPDGKVDERSIKEVKPSDLKGFAQCHFFAGIGGWSEALRIADWPTDRHVWTGSCPCQPLSVAGLGKGAEDERHLWPAFAELICYAEPSVVFGEQVASADGREWFDGIRLDLEAMGYAIGAADLCAASVGAKQIRQRILWVADVNFSRRSWERQAQPTKRESDIIIAWDGKDISNAYEKRRKDNEEVGWTDKQARRENPSSNNVGRRRGSWPAEPDVVRVVHGVSTKVGAAVGCFGNSIVPQVAAEFIKAYMAVSY